MKKKDRKALTRLRRDIDNLTDNYNRAIVRQQKEIADLRERVRRNDITIRGALVPFVNDLAMGVTDGTVEFKVDTDYEDFTSLLGGAVTRVAARRELWHCTYDSSRVRYEDGELVEQKVTWKP